MMPTLSLEQKKRLISEAYEYQKELHRSATGEEKARKLKDRNACAVYATCSNIGRMTPKTFSNVITKYHPTVSIKSIENFEISYK